MTQCEIMFPKMTPKDHALVVWSLARLKYPREGPLFAICKEYIEKNLEIVGEETYLLDKEDITELSHAVGAVEEEVKEAEDENWMRTGVSEETTSEDGTSEGE